ncbi:MAG: TonB-dependent receptor [Candidatus Cryptobacteroides sp.]|nr:TonB-dependent receptor [Candidatus Cryptobacteroides sp.]
MKKLSINIKSVSAFLSTAAAVLMLLVPPFAEAQAQTASGTVSGTVLDQSGNPMAGATIIATGKGGKTGTMADASGKYSIKAGPEDVIEVQYLGYVSQSAKVGSKKVIDFTLAEDENMLEETVVIGYGTVKKQDLTGSVTNVKMNDLKSAPQFSVDNALQGRIAGADIMSTSGEPGATTTIRIRGSRSITASNEPLIVVDGIMDAIHDLNDLNSDDIASISVLKDASSTAIYGSRGANGVIIVTTKAGTGNKGKTNVSFKADVGFSQLPRKLDIMNAAEFAMYRNDLAAFGSDANNPDKAGWDTPLSESIYADPLSRTGTDWIDAITRTALYQNYALTISGASDKGNYYTSFSYNDADGIIKDSGQKRFTGRVKFERQLFKWLKASYSGSYTWRHNDQAKASIGGTAWYNSAMYLNPFIKPTDSFNPLYNGGQKINNPIALIKNNTYYLERHSTNHSFSVDVTPFKNFVIKSTFSYYLYQRHTYRYYPGTLPAKAENEGGEAYRAEWDEHSLSSETTIRYNFNKNGHTLVPMLGYSAYSFLSHDFSLSGKGYTDDAVMWNNMNAVLDKETYSASTGYSKKTKNSVFARLDYNWKSRYYLTATVRGDGASNFAENNKWAFFPSAALRWNVANEPFMKNVKWIDDLSVRASYGITGNDAISAYRSLAVNSTTTGGYLFDGSQPVATYRSRLDSPDLKWEKTTLYNLAIDWSMFKNRLNITAEIYYSKTKDLLLNVQVPTNTGYSTYLANKGTTSNKGIELSIESVNINRRNFQWSTAFTISHNEQKVLDIGQDDFVVAYSSPGNNSYMMYGYVNGYPLNSLWGFKYGGTWKSTEEVERNKVTKTYAATSNTLGGPRYYDINHDGTLDQKDLVYQGNSDPVLYGGLQNNFYWKGFRLGIFFNYSLGGKIYNYSEFYMAGSIFTNQYRYMLDAWHPTRNPESDIPRAGGKTDAALASDFMIHDASYIRLKNVSLGYTLDLQKYRCPLKDITFTVSGENLYLWKNYNGFDPDVNSSGTSSTLRRLDIGAYPKSRTIMFSIQIRY